MAITDIGYCISCHHTNCPFPGIKAKGGDCSEWTTPSAEKIKYEPLIVVPKVKD